ncbi:MAG: radical SAM protein [Candidatus Omnitrophota bacterium]
MHITFVHSHYENLGIEYISAYLKKAGHTTSLLFEPALFRTFFAHNKTLNKAFSFKKEFLRKVIKTRPDLVAFSVISDNYQWSCELAREIKNNLDVIVVFGGIHPTAVPEPVINEDFVDFVIIGEGEETMLELTSALAAAKNISTINNLCFKNNGQIIKNPLRPPIEKLDSIPFPDKDLFFKECPMLVRQSYMVVASRGCKNSCSYCVNDFINRIYKNNSYYRRRSVRNVIDELAWAKQKYGIKSVTFYDEVFTADKEWLNHFLIEYKDKINRPFFCCIYPKNIDKKMVDKLAAAGCSSVNIGIQTISEEIRKSILNRYGNNDEIKQAIKLLKQANLYIYANIMLGLPTQTEDELIKTLFFCSENKPDISTIYWLRYYPKTAIIDIAQKQGLLSKKDIDDIEAGKCYAPYAMKGNTFNPKLARIGNLMLISGVIPTPVMRFIIRRKIYRLFPAANMLFPALVIIAVYKRLFSGKKKTFHYFNIFDYFKFYLFYIIKKFKISRKYALGEKI